jgi:hypothetical protein
MYVLRLYLRGDFQNEQYRMGLPHGFILILACREANLKTLRRS